MTPCVIRPASFAGLLACALGLASFVQPAIAQQRFQLAVPGTNVRSDARIDALRLRITDALGQSFTYTRTPQLDSEDGRFLGYFNETLGRAVRWPVDGRGPMQLGDVRDDRVDFRDSRMHVFASNVDPPLPIPPARPPFVPQAPAGPPVNDATQVFRPPFGGLTGRGGSTWVASAESGRGRMQAGFVDQRGQACFAQPSREGGWEMQQGQHERPLPADAPVALLDAGRNQLPTLFVVQRDGQLVRLRSGGLEQAYSANAYAPRTSLEVGWRDNMPLLWAVDQTGRLPELQVERDANSGFVEPVAGELVPGSGLAVVDGREAFVVARDGTVRRYVFDRSWRRDDPLDRIGRPIASAFAPGGALTAFRAASGRGGQLRTHLVAFNATGRLQFAYESDVPGRWEFRRVGDVRGLPGSPVAAVYDGERFCISVVDADGIWSTWESLTPDGLWRSVEVARGFVPYAPTTWDRRGPHGFAVDGRGRLVVASRGVRGGWECIHVVPGGGPGRPILPPAQVLVSREVTAAANLPPVNVEFANTYRRELWVLIADLSNPANVIRLKIKPDKSQTVRLERDGGSRVVENFQVTGPLGGTRIEQQVYEIPAQALYDVSVYELFLQSVAIDRTKDGGGKIEDVNWSPKSVGIFQLPAGAALEEGSVLDVYAAAKAAENPGGVRRLVLENWKQGP